VPITGNTEGPLPNAPGSGAPEGQRNGMSRHGRYSKESMELRRIIRLRAARGTVSAY
jgi:hypothetical protein